MKFINAESENRIQIRVEHNRDLGGTPNLGHTIEHAARSCPGLQRALRRQLVDNAICQRIRKWQAELEQIRAVSLQRQCDLNGPGKIWIARANVGNRSEERRVGKECSSRGAPHD